MRILAIIAVIVLAVLAFGFSRVSPILAAGSGFAAKNICSGHFLSGFDGETVRSQSLEGASGVFSNVDFKIDTDEKWAETSFFGQYKRRAVFKEGLGCILLSKGQNQLGWSLDVDTTKTIASDAAVPWPEGAAGAPDNERYKAFLDQAFNEESAESPRNTKAIVVVHKGRIIAERYADGVTSQTPLIGWSMSKSVTALLMGLLVQDGAIDIHAPAPIDAWNQDEGDHRSKITTDTLLRMSSGLEFDEDDSVLNDALVMLADSPDSFAYAAAKPLLHEPDTFYHYSSGTTVILSEIIEKTLGGVQESYDFMQTRFFDRLGLDSAVLEPDATGTLVGSSYLYASPYDWARLGQFCLQRGVWNNEVILPDSWFDYVLTPTQTNQGNEYGAQFWLNRTPNDPNQEGVDVGYPELPEDAFFMMGWQGQIVMIIPSKDLVLVRLGFAPARNHGIGTLAAQIIEALNLS